MKLYLSSYQFGNNPQLLADLIGENKNIAIIPNALDNFPDIKRRQLNINNEKKGLIAIGLHPQVIDLRVYFNKKHQLTKKLASFGSFWVLGGNVFVLRRAMYQSGLDNWLIQNKNPEFVYAGYSAGICVITQNLKNIKLLDYPHAVPKGYDSKVIWKGIGLVGYTIVPHFDSPGHPTAKAAGKQVEQLIKQGEKFKALRDGEIIIANT